MIRDEVLDRSGKLKTSKPLDPEVIHMRDFRELKHELLDLLTYIWNLSLNSTIGK